MFSDCFIGLDSLKRLEIEHNRLTQLNPGAFNGLSKIEELYMGYNFFQSIKQDILPKTLLKISLEYTHQLTTVPNGTFAGMMDLNEVNFVLLFFPLL